MKIETQAPWEEPAPPGTSKGQGLKVGILVNGEKLNSSNVRLGLSVSEMPLAFQRGTHEM